MYLLYFTAPADDPSGEVRGLHTVRGHDAARLRTAVATSTIDEVFLGLVKASNLRVKIRAHQVNIDRTRDLPGIKLRPRAHIHNNSIPVALHLPSQTQRYSNQNMLWFSQMF